MYYLDNINSPGDLKKLNSHALQFLCGEIREFLIESLSETGGHLASNLGVVELTVALHKALASPTDKIIWDVGHQAYVHKLLTGRREAFKTLRQMGGLSGFPKSSESRHDAFGTGHASTSISAALGIAKSRDLKGERFHVAAVIGDGSMTGGLAFEALNNAGHSDTNLMVILNDNQMSISENVGGLPRHLNDIRTAPAYIEVKADVHEFLRKVPVLGGKVARFIQRTKDAIKYVLVPVDIFEELGFTYIGPIDGHNVAELVRVLERAKRLSGPLLLHVYTRKGKGYDQAEEAPSNFHGVDSFHVATGMPRETKIWDTYTDVFGKALTEAAAAVPRIVAVTAAMPGGTGLAAFGEKFPARMFDVGIAEGHAVTFAAGMAKNGHLPVVAIYSTFLQRAYDQVLHDVCLQNLHVVFAVANAGVVGPDGETHQGLYDVAFLSHMPNMTVLAPKNKNEFKLMLNFALEHNGPVALRYPKSAASRVLREALPPLELGKSETVVTGGGILLVSVGSMMDTAWEVYERLKRDGLTPGLVNARFLKPQDDALADSLANYEHVYILEEGAARGGYGEGLLAGAVARGVAVRHAVHLAFPDEFIPQGTRKQIFEAYGLDADSIYSRIKAECL